MTDYKPQPKLPDPFKPSGDPVLPPAGPVLSRLLPPPMKLTDRPSGWYTIPKPIRFVIWVQAIVFLLGFAAAAIVAVFWLLAFGLALGSL